MIIVTSRNIPGTNPDTSRALSETERQFGTLSLSAPLVSGGLLALGLLGVIASVALAVNEPEPPKSQIIQAPWV